MREELKARREDKLMCVVAFWLVVIAMIGFALCAYYQVPIVG